MAKSTANPRPDMLLNDKTVVLVGIMGSGKTTVGKRLANLLGMPFSDADEEIEKAAGMPVSDYFDLYGEAEFRKGERRVMKRLLDQPPHVLATGGGAFADEKIRHMIKTKAISVWLQADIDVVFERTARRDTRPLLKNGDPRSTLERLIEERTPYYAQADIHVGSTKGPHLRTAEKIVKCLGDFVQ